MPRANLDQRLARDRLVFDLWLAGHSLRAIACHPNVGLSLDTVHEVVCRERLQLDTEERLEENFAAAYQAADAGDVAAASRCRLILERLAPLKPPPEDDTEPIPVWVPKKIKRYRVPAKYRRRR